MDFIALLVSSDVLSLSLQSSNISEESNEQNMNSAAQARISRALKEKCTTEGRAQRKAHSRSRALREKCSPIAELYEKSAPRKQSSMRKVLPRSRAVGEKCTPVAEL